MKLIFENGNQCSRNFKFKNKIESIGQLMQVLETQPSVFWNHRPFPCAVVVQQKLVVLLIAIKYGRLWEIDKIQGGNK